MKHSIKGLFVILAIVMSFIAVQSVSAGVFIVEGEITLKDERPNTVKVETTDGPIYVNGVRYKYLEKHFDISLEKGDQVAFMVYEYLCDDGELLNKACKLLKPDTDPEVPDNWIDLRTCIEIY